MEPQESPSGHPADCRALDNLTADLADLADRERETIDVIARSIRHSVEEPTIRSRLEDLRETHTQALELLEEIVNPRVESYAIVEYSREHMT